MFPNCVVKVCFAALDAVKVMALKAFLCRERGLAYINLSVELVSYQIDDHRHIPSRI